MHRENQDSYLRKGQLDFHNEFNPGASSQRNIHHHSIGCAPPDLLHSFRRAFRFAAKSKIGLPIDKMTKPLANKRMIVHQEYPLTAFSQITGCHPMQKEVPRLREKSN
jgi:hypothetical protein